MKLLPLGFATLAALSPFSAQAITWSGLSTTLPGTSVAANPGLAGPTIASQTFSFSPNGGTAPDITVTNYVVRETASGTLDFYYQFNNPNDTPATLTQIALTGFDIGPALDVDMRNDLMGSFQSSFASRFPGGGSVPDQVVIGPTAVSSVWTLAAGASLEPIFIHTSATAFTSTGSIIVIPNTITNSGFAPAAAAAVPEPLSLALLPLALAALTLRVRRQTR